MHWTTASGAIGIGLLLRSDDLNYDLKLVPGQSLPSLYLHFIIPYLVMEVILDSFSSVSTSFVAKLSTSDFSFSSVMTL